MNDLLVDGQMLLYGFVGDEWGGFTATQVINSLSSVKGQDITVRINSGGGYVDDGVAIYHALRLHDGDVTVIVDSIAASAASVIAMAGSTVVMRRGASMMIHDPSVMTIGTADDHAKSGEYLEARASALAEIYAAKTGKSLDDVRAAMKEETWMTADEAVSQGFADSVEEIDADPAEAFDYRVYAKAPEPLRAMAAAKGWRVPSKTRAQAAGEPPPAVLEPVEAPDPAPTEAQAHASGEPPADPAPAEPAAAPDAEASAIDRATAIFDLCTSAGVPQIATSMIREGLTVEQAKGRIDGAKAIREAVNLAHRTCEQIDPALADAYIAAGSTVEQVRAELFTRMAKAQEALQTISQHSASYEPRNSSTSTWDKTVARINARIG